MFFPFRLSFQPPMCPPGLTQGQAKFQSLMQGLRPVPELAWPKSLIHLAPDAVGQCRNYNPHMSIQYLTAGL